MKTEEHPSRIWEIDFFRGLAIILVVGYHLLFDLGEFAGVQKVLFFSTNLSTAAWSIAQHFFAGVFVVISGISSSLSRNNLRRGWRLLAVSFVVTAATYFFDPSSAVLFGILHCLSVSILIYAGALKKASATVCAVSGAFILAFGLLVLPLLKKSLVIRLDWLLPFGIYSTNFSSFDYYPLIPWFGVFLSGVALGKWLYGPKRSLLPRPLPETFFNFAGRHSLLIYIVHQPLILGILYLLGYVKLF